MNIEQAEMIASLINARDEFQRVKNILVTDLSNMLNGPCIINVSSADVVVGNYKASLSKTTIKRLVRLIDDQCNLIEQTISSYNENIIFPIGSDD